MISFQGVSLRREQRQILKDIEFTIQDNEQWVILGRNGSGKTTILEMMNGYLFPSKGRVEVLGNVYGQCDVREVRKQIGYISQSLIDKLNLSDPVWEVVATGAFAFLRFYQQIPPEVEEAAFETLELLNIRHLAKSPLGVLSQGERKKVMLARALMSKPKLLVLDEPCSGLDLFEREKLLADLKLLAERGMQMVYVTHHVEEIMPFFTHIGVIHEGELLAAGRKEDVMGVELFERVFGIKGRIHWEADRPWLHVIS